MNLYFIPSGCHAFSGFLSCHFWYPSVWYSSPTWPNLLVIKCLQLSPRKQSASKVRSIHCTSLLHNMVIKVSSKWLSKFLKLALWSIISWLSSLNRSLSVLMSASQDYYQDINSISWWLDALTEWLSDMPRRSNAQSPSTILIWLWYI